MQTLTIDLPADVEPDEIKLWLSIKLFELGKLSLGQAARMAGYPKRDYMVLLGKQGVPVIDYDPEELKGEQEL